jgi:hypothetical protein
VVQVPVDPGLQIRVTSKLVIIVAIIDVARLKINKRFIFHFEICLESVLK